MTEAKLHADKAKAERFRMWATQDGLYDALDSMKTAYTQAIITAPAGDDQSRRNGAIAVRLIDQIRSQVEATIAREAVADTKLERIRKRKATKDRAILGTW